MTFAELPELLEHLQFDITVIPARRGPVTLAEFEFDELEKYWGFRFRYDDIVIPVPTKELPAKLWDAIRDNASPGDDDTVVYGLSKRSGWEDKTPVAEIAVGLLDDLNAFVADMQAQKDTVDAYLKGI
jgi:hypothetical protein